jgi:hypothetical protein
MIQYQDPSVPPDCVSEPLNLFPKQTAWHWIRIRDPNFVPSFPACFAKQNVSRRDAGTLRKRTQYPSPLCVSAPLREILSLSRFPGRSDSPNRLKNQNPVP